MGVQHNCMLIFVETRKVFGFESGMSGMMSGLLNMRQGGCSAIYYSIDYRVNLSGLICHLQIVQLCEGVTHNEQWLCYSSPLPDDPELMQFARTSLNAPLGIQREVS